MGSPVRVTGAWELARGFEKIESSVSDTNTSIQGSGPHPTKPKVEPVEEEGKEEGRADFDGLKLRRLPPGQSIKSRIFYFSWLAGQGGGESDDGGIRGGIGGNFLPASSSSPFHSR